MRLNTYRFAYQFGTYYELIRHILRANMCRIVRHQYHDFVDLFLRMKDLIDEMAKLLIGRCVMKVAQGTG